MSRDALNRDLPEPTEPNELFMVPLGGVEEFGINLTCYGHRGRWLMVDCGAGFPDDNHPGIDLVFPNPRFIEERRELLDGIIITHAHEDHVGAVAHLWPRLQVPIWCTPFARAVLLHKFSDRGVDIGPWLRDMRPGRVIEAGVFKILPIAMAHSIPEAVALAIATAAGTLLHTGDWKIDPDPVVGWRTDEVLLQKLGERGVLAVVSDSTNSGVIGLSGSERTVEENLIRLFGQIQHRIIVTCFASNIARIRSVAMAAQANDRRVALVGRSMNRMAEIAGSLGYLAGVPAFLKDTEVHALPPSKVVVLCTGSQGEPGSALTRIAGGDHPEIALQPDDTVIYSSRTIPGNEREILRVRRQLILQGAEILTDRDGMVHVSGHATQGEITQLYQWLKPKIVIPVHGEITHLQSNARLAESCQVPVTAIPVNGSVLRLTSDGTVQEIGQVETELLALDGDRVGDLHGGATAARRRLSEAGFAAISLVVGSNLTLKVPPRVSLVGVASPEEEDRLAEMIEGQLEREIRNWLNDGRNRRSRAPQLEDQVRISVRRQVKRAIGKRPMIDIAILEV